MKAMILAAGRGQRLRPLTDHTPKPLLKVGGKALIEYHLEKLAAVGIEDVIINIAYLGRQICRALGNGSHWGLNIHYSVEPEPLETAGAVFHALPLLGDEPFLLINSDVWTDYPFELGLRKPLNDALGYLVLVDNPKHNPEGDYAIAGGRLRPRNGKALTFSGISVLSPDLIKTYPQARTKFPLREVFVHAMGKDGLLADSYSGQWWDIGTLERLQALDQLLPRSK